MWRWCEYARRTRVTRRLWLERTCCRSEIGSTLAKGQPLPLLPTNLVRSTRLPTRSTKLSAASVDRPRSPAVEHAVSSRGAAAARLVLEHVHFKAHPPTLPDVLRGIDERRGRR